jgi:hypothetical protein
MNVEIGAEAALFPEKEIINGIAVAVHRRLFTSINNQLEDQQAVVIGKNQMSTL